MIGIGGRHADRPIEIRQRLLDRAGLRHLNAALDLAHRLEILADPGAILGSELRLQASDVVAQRVQEAGPPPQRGAPIGGAAALTEQPLEDDARMRLGREGRGRRRPREIVLIDAGVAVVALADGLEQIHRQLERRQQRLVSDLLRGDLIDGGAQVVVGALRPFRLCRAQERGVGRRMRAGVGVLQLQVADHRELIDDRSQRLQRGRELDQADLRSVGVQRVRSQPIGM